MTSVSLSAIASTLAGLCRCQQSDMLEIGPKGPAYGRDGRLLRLMFETNKCKYTFELVSSTG